MEDSNRMKARNPSPLFTAVAIMSVVGSAMAVADEVLSVPLGEVPSRMECPLNGQPLAFEENLGQVDPEVQFLSRGPGYQLFLTGTEAVMVGMVLFALDGLIFLLAQDWLGVGFHALVLWWLFRGFGACRQLNASR
jgi:hypothetical protein